MKEYCLTILRCESRGHEDLPCSLSIAGRNLWQEQIDSAGLALSPLRRGCNMLAISIPSIALGVIDVSKTFIWLDYRVQHL